MNTIELQEYIVRMRREFHMYPELSGEETRTSSRICEELESMGIPYEIAGDKNVIGRIDNGEGKRIAFRADFDALPVQEKVDVPWKSKIPGCMHACGHDAHAACLLGAAKLFLGRKDEWSGTIFLCFQQGEEAGLGAEECVDYLKKHGGVDAAFGVHLMGFMPTGIVMLKPGAVATGASIFHINIEGRSGHGARPDLSVSAADIMCDIYQHIVAIPSNRHEAARTCVISPCKLEAGSRFNVIPDHASIEGTIRFMGMDDGPVLMEKVTKTAESIANLHGGKASVQYDIVSPQPLINDKYMTAIGIKAAERVGFAVPDVESTTASDNFAAFLYEFPGYYCFVGSQSDRPGTSGVHHAPDFDIDESMLYQIPELYMETILELS